MKKNIDRDKLHHEIQKLSRDDLINLLDRAIEYLPKTRLPKVFTDHFGKEKRTKTRSEPKPNDILSEIKNFHKASFSGKYYESFNVNSKNYMNQSSGTKKWIYECNRLLNLCVTMLPNSCKSLREGMSLLFELLHYIDDGYDDIVFFADEGGSWQVGIDWDKVLTAWFKCLSETSGPDEFVQETVKIIDNFVSYDRKKYLKIAHKNATSIQRKVLPKS